MRALLGLLIAACVAVPLPSQSPSTTAIPLAVPSPTATAAPITSAPSRVLGPESTYGLLVTADPGRFSWKVRRENDPAALVTIAGDWPSVSPDGKTIAFWAPAGVRTQLRIVSASGGPERTLLTLPAEERGETIAWGTGSSGLAVGVDANAILHGGIDPAPSFSAIRTIDLLSGEAREVMRRDETRLRPFGWARGPRLVVAAEFGGLGRIIAYVRAGEDGTVVRDVFDTSASADCTHAIALRLDTAATTIMSIQPQRCSDGSGKAPGGSILRLWPIGQGSAQAQVYDLGSVFLLDAQFRPGALEFVTVVARGTTLVAQLWQGRTSRDLTTIAITSAGVQDAFVFRPNAAVLLLYWPSQATANAIAWHGRLVDVTSDKVADFELGADRPIASVYLGP